MAEEKAGKGQVPSIAEDAFEALERDFQDVLHELMGDKSLEKFRVEYEKLHQALKKSHESEKRLVTKCRELNAEIASHAAKVSEVLKLSQDDKSTIVSLKKEIEKLWNMLETSHEKEQRGRQTIQSLKVEIANLTTLVEKGAGLNFGGEQQTQELAKEKENLTKQLEESLEEVSGMRGQLGRTQEEVSVAEQRREEAELRVSALEKETKIHKQNEYKEVGRRRQAEDELEKKRGELEARDREISAKQAELNQLSEEKSRLDGEISDLRGHLERQGRDLELLEGKHHKLQGQYYQLTEYNDQLAEEMEGRNRELKAKEEELNGVKQDSAKISRERDRLQKRVTQKEEEKNKLEMEKDTLKAQISGLEREVDQMKKLTDSKQRQMDDLLRERDNTKKLLRKTETEVDRKEEMIKLQDTRIHNLERDRGDTEGELGAVRKHVKALEKERENYFTEAEDVMKQCTESMNEVKKKEMKIFELRKKIAEADKDLKQQQNLYEAARSDRNLYSKNLIEAQDEISEFKRKIKIMTHQIDQLKDEIATNDAALLREKNEHLRVEKEKEGLNHDLTQRKLELTALKQHLENQRAEERKLNKIIAEADGERLRQKKQLEQVINERDILGTQLIRRNDELALLYEKIKIQTSTLSKGEVQYRARVDDIRILMSEVRNLRREKGLLHQTVANVDELRREVHHTQRELIKERTRCKALEEELENPMNVHRWRKLEGSDPSTFEVLQKIQTLQRRLIHKTEEAVEKELQIQEKERLYLELRRMLEKNPGPEMSQQLQLYQQTLREKTKKMKSMASELNMYQSQIAENRLESDRLSRELQEVKKKYYLQKKREQQGRERERALAQMSEGPHPPAAPKGDHPRFTGGGFNMKQPPKVSA